MKKQASCLEVAKVNTTKNLSSDMLLETMQYVRRLVNDPELLEVDEEGYESRSMVISKGW